MRSLVIRLCLAAFVFFAGSSLTHAQMPGAPGPGGGGQGVGINVGGGYKDHARVIHNRHLQGTVLDAAGKSVPNAIVYIKNMKNNETATLIADEHGAYRIGALDKNADYQLWAKADKKIGPVKTLSEYDTRDELTLNLHVD